MDLANPLKKQAVMDVEFVRLKKTFSLVVRTN